MPKTMEEKAKPKYLDIQKTEFELKILYKGQLFLKFYATHPLDITKIRTLLLHADIMKYISMTDACEILEALGEEEYYDG